MEKLGQIGWEFRMFSFTVCLLKDRKVECTDVQNRYSFKVLTETLYLQRGGGK